MLKQGWFDSGSLERTLENLIEAADRDYLSSVAEDAFIDALIREFRFVSCLPKELDDAVENFVREHSAHFYRYARRVADSTE